jgi:hypothetical protein
MSVALIKSSDGEEVRIHHFCKKDNEWFGGMLCSLELNGFWMNLIVKASQQVTFS